MFKRSYLTLLLLCYGCEGSYRGIIKKNLLYSTKCKTDERKFMYQEKPPHSQHNERHEGHFSLGRKKDFMFMTQMEKPIQIETSKDYIELFGSGIFAIPEWVQIQVQCSCTDEIIFDSGKIFRDDALCKQNGQLLFVIDSNKRKRETNSCCEPGLECPSE